MLGVRSRTGKSSDWGAERSASSLAPAVMAMSAVGVEGMKLQVGVKSMQSSSRGRVETRAGEIIDLRELDVKPINTGINI